MPRARDIIVTETVKGIEEVVSKHIRTKRGTIRTTEKVIPVLRPTKETPAQSTRSKKKGKQPQHCSDVAEGSGGAIPVIDDVQTFPYMDEHDYGLPDTAPEDSRPRITVCIKLK